MSLPADAVLLDATVRGDARAFRALYARHEAAVYRLAYGVLLDAAEARDVTQEVFVRLHREAARWRPEAPLSTWLHRVTLNEALSVRRRLARLLRAPERVPPGGTERAFALQESAAFFRRAMQGLPPRQRAVLTLHFDEDLSPTEIAPLLGATPNATRVMLHRALAALRTAAREAGLEMPDDEPAPGADEEAS